MRWSKTNKDKDSARDIEKSDETEQLLPGLNSYSKEVKNDPSTDIDYLAKLARDSQW